MTKLQPWQANDLGDDFEERGFHPTKWEEITDFDEEGYGCVCTDNGWGFVDRNGNLLISDEYEMFSHPFFVNGYCIAKKGGKYGIIDRQNAEIFPFIYDSLFAGLNGDLPKVSGYRDGKWKITDLNSNTLLELDEEELFSFNCELLIVSKDSKHGVIDYDKNVVLGFEWEHLEFVGSHLCAGKSVDVFFKKDELNAQGIFYSDYFKHFTKDYQKIAFGVIDLQENILFPFISDSPIREFNPENGRAKISRNYWENPQLDDDDLCFVADYDGNKIPFDPPISELERNETFHSRCRELIFG